MEDALIERLNSVAPNDETKVNIEVETDDSIDAVVSDIAVEDDFLVVGSQSPVAPDEEEFVSEGVDYEYIILSESNVNYLPSYC